MSSDSTNSGFTFGGWEKLSGPDEVKTINALISQCKENYQVRLSRLFISNEQGEPCNNLDAGFIVACDHDGYPILGPNGPLTFKLKIVDLNDKSTFDGKYFSHRTKFPFLEKDKIFVSKSTKFFSERGLLVLDEPNESDIVFRPVDGISSRLTEYYGCKAGSSRSTIAFDKTGRGHFLGIVGSRYAVLQNDEVAADALEFIRSSAESTQFATHVESTFNPTFLFSNQSSFWSQSFFGINLHLGQQTKENLTLSQSLVLGHSHDTKFAYNHIWILRCEVVGLGEPAILGQHKVKIKHTKNIGDRAQIISATLAEIQNEYKKWEDDLSAFKKIELSDMNVNKFLKDIEDESKNWLSDRRKLVYIEDIAPKIGFNLLSLFLAVARVEGRYWDGKISSSGLPSLLEVSESMKPRREARSKWLEKIDKSGN